MITRDSYVPFDFSKMKEIDTAKIGVSRCMNCKKDFGEVFWIEVDEKLICKDCSMRV